MDIQQKLMDEFKHLCQFKTKAITINGTAKDGEEFKVLPRRFANDTAISGFLVNEEQLLVKTLCFFDGKVDTIFVDVERKKRINLFEIANNTLTKSKLVALKTNDMTIEACDALVRYHFQDDLREKNIIVIGTGNLASKITLRLSERQANVFILGRNEKKERLVTNGLNSFLPAYSPKIKLLRNQNGSVQLDAIISFISGKFTEESLLNQHLRKETFIVDGGINNFSGGFIKRVIEQGMTITRLDVRLGLPYQFLSTSDFATNFFTDVYGEKKWNEEYLVSGGFIGEEGAVIVDNIKEPVQIIGIADGMGGVKHNEKLTESNRESIRKIKEAISIGM
ncbi:hypothetical protein [Virgibacillus halodenitrificans]|uniref:hypothetical protein n=1 Tax=Virgibacillus halodenitrificans TaxID=1482 RepID=UPI000EF4CA16|nr:hypothetical protein [Virgibacillus halodenitrificans]MCG1027067.1 hypothetical protein [Virgibacillus halodenitrificans]